MIYRLARSIGFRLDPERAHRMALRMVRVRHAVPASARRFEVAPAEVMGLRFRNPLGLAAGYDKDGVAWRALAGLGFGHIEVGTVTPRPQKGNPPPRLHRVPQHTALVNRLGFPSAGADVVARRISGKRPHGVVVGVSIGPNADTPPDGRLDDYLALVERFAPIADYLALNVSSPNTPGVRALGTATTMGSLVAAVRRRRDEIGARAPLAVKVSPDAADLAAVVAAAADAGADGIIATNTTTSRPGGVGEGLAGGLSGAPLRLLALDAVRTATAAGLPVIACGGITASRHAAEALDAGAALVQVYTGMVYRGPRLVTEILDAVA